jgi:hypothetical protein
MTIGLGLSYSMRHAYSNISYNFTFREQAALSDPSNKKLILTGTSLVSVLIRKLSQIANLKKLLE